MFFFLLCVHSKMCAGLVKGQTRNRSLVSLTKGQGDKPQKRHGIVLTDKEAFEIYKFKFPLDKFQMKGRSVPVSRKFNVSPKTVRDIWNQRTWTNATRPLWSAYEVGLNICYFTSFDQQRVLQLILLGFPLFPVKEVPIPCGQSPFRKAQKNIRLNSFRTSPAKRRWQGTDQQ